MDVFNYTGSRMVSKGNFFALMLFIMGIGTAMVYCVVGYTGNTVAQASSTTITRITSWANRFKDSEPKIPKRNIR